MILNYRTIQGETEGIYKEKGSKFLAFAFPVKDEVEIKSRLDELRKKYYDARHHCYAYVVGPDKKKYRANDDGEPNHSAGDPILGQIRSLELTDVLVVVVRYFGGTKLGVGGLITAYKTAAEDALRKIVVVEKDVVDRITLEYSYSATPEVMKLVKDFDLKILDQRFGEGGRLDAEYRIAVESELLAKLTLLRALGSDVVWKK